MSVVTRFAPSPTGYLHVGNLRTAVLNWLVARKAHGVFILRIDDTDEERSRTEFTDQIKRDLEWLGLGWDREENQSSRLARYDAAADALREAKRLYECFETPLELDLRRKAQLAGGRPPVYDRGALLLTDAERDEMRTTRNPHWRFLLDRHDIRFEDLIRGPQRVDAASLSDPVLFRADGQLLYTLASVVDDAEMGVTHVVRGADHVTNTGAQIQIFEALQKEPPAFAHHSLLTGADGSALSKRLGTLALKDLRDAGVEPVALVGFMARLGASLPVEVVSDLNGITAAFDLGQFGMTPTKFSPDELELHSAKTLRALPFDAVADRLLAAGLDENSAREFWDVVGPNLDRMDDARGWLDLLQNGTEPLVDADDLTFASQALRLLPPRPWTRETWSSWTGAVKAASGRKGRKLFQPLRMLLTGRRNGPDMAQLLPLMMGPLPKLPD